MEHKKPLLIRPIQERDSLEDLTELLHRAYKQLADMGMRFFASHQTVQDTHHRVAGGICYVAELDSRIVGTVTWYHRPPRDPDPPLYHQAGMARFGQFAVEPALQRGGIGRKLVALVEAEARKAGCTQLALDTAEQAAHLIDWYLRLGFQHAGFVQWADTNYRSVLMSKPLGH